MTRTYSFQTDSEADAEFDRKAEEIMARRAARELRLVQNPPDEGHEGAGELDPVRQYYHEREAKKRVTEFGAGDLWDASFPPVTYVVPDIIAQGVTLLCGAPKLGKSWLALDIANAVHRGGYVLGETLCANGAVLYAALEDNPRRLKDRLRKVCARKPDNNLTIWFEMPTLDNGGIERLQDWCDDAENPRLIIIDVLNKVRPPQGKNEAPYAHDYRTLEPLVRLAGDRGIAIVCVHHVRKMGADDALERVSGTNGLTGAADATIVLSRDGQGVTLSGRGRDIAEFEYALEFQKDNCRWHILGDAGAIRVSSERQAILKALRTSPEPMTTRDVADLTGKSDLVTRKTLSRMSQKGEVKKVSRGVWTVSDISPLSQQSQSHNEADEDHEM